MDIKEAIIKHLISSNLGTDKIHYTTAPVDEKPPYMVVSVISAVRSRTHDGVSRAAQSRVQIDLFGSSDTETEHLFQQTRELLEEVQNQVIGGNAGVFVAQFILEDEIDDYNSDTKLFHKIMDYVVQYYEEV